MYARRLLPSGNYHDAAPHLINIHKWQPGKIKHGQVQNGMPLCDRGEVLTVTKRDTYGLGGLATTIFAVPAAFDPSDPNTWDRPVIFT